MSFSVLPAVRHLEKQFQKVLTEMAIASQGGPLPPQAAKLCSLSRSLTEMRVNLERGDEPAISGKEGDWGSAFRKPASPEPTDDGPQSVAQAWVEEDATQQRPTGPGTPLPKADPQPIPDHAPATMRPTEKPPSGGTKPTGEDAWQDMSRWEDP